MSRDFWMSMGMRCRTATAPNEHDNPGLSTIAGDMCKQLMARDDYPTIGTLISQAIVLGNINSAVKLIETLFPGWGYQVGRPLTVRKPCGWYASVFRERRASDTGGPLAGMWPQDGRRNGGPAQYADDPALALVAALCYVLAENEAGTSAIAAAA